LDLVKYELEKEETKMFCEKCGKKLEDGVKFCPSCGNRVEIPENQTDTVHEQPEKSKKSRKKVNYHLF